MSSEQEQPNNLATAVADVSERAIELVREEIELAKAEVSRKVSRLIKGVVVGLAAGIFVVVALLFMLHGVAWVLSDYVFGAPQWGYLVTAGILLLLAFIAGLLAAKAVKSGAPPTPDLAIEEARKIKETVGEVQAER